MEVLGLAWPQPMAQIEKSISVDGLARREADALFFLNAAFPRDDDLDMDFLNINPDLLMVLNGCLDWTSQNEKEGGDKKFEVRKSPWKQRPGTIIGSCKMIVRYAYEGVEVVRAWEAFEYLAAIGWHPESWEVARMTPGKDEVAVQDAAYSYYLLLTYCMLLAYCLLVACLLYLLTVCCLLI